MIDKIETYLYKKLINMIFIKNEPISSETKLN